MTMITRILVAAAAVGMGLSAAAADISGAGATFPYPIYAKWADAYKKLTGVGLNYHRSVPAAASSKSKAKTVTSAPPTCR